ncbi:MAG TPA: NAD(P)H-hydrate dehydratase [Clostridiales bacterium]|nr:NAD(P)H-hydrate dehydratase [Clostridiales bacterium]
MYLYSSKQMNEIDRYNEQVLNIDIIELMRRAGKALAQAVKTTGKKNIAIVCGTGNNGGDGLACAVFLSDMLAVDVYLTGEIKSKAAKHYLTEAQKKNISIYQDFEKDFSKYDLVIDAIFGTGLKKETTGAYKEIINAINQSGAYIISADIPSGLNSDNGLIEGVCIKADLTVTFAGYKLGQFLNQGPDVCGKIILDDIKAVIPLGDYVYVPKRVVLPKRRKDSHKGDYANIKIIAGSDTMCGAAYLGLSAANAALRSGAGLVTLAVPSSIKCAYMSRVTESMLYFLSNKDGKVIFIEDEIDELLKKADVLIIGMGLGKSAEVGKIIDYVLQNYSITVIIDADGLGSLNLDSLKDTKCEVILTPHIGEFARLTKSKIDDIKLAPITLAKKFSQEYGAIVVLKSNATIITDGAQVWLNTTGTPAQAKGGSGDVLAGCLGALRKILPPLEACYMACYISGSAAILVESQKGSYSVLASDVIQNIPNVIKDLIEK